jgi:hypothetical protein
MTIDRWISVCLGIWSSVPVEDSIARFFKTALTGSIWNEL